MWLCVYGMSVNVNGLYYAHACEQSLWARWAGNSAIENLCIIITMCWDLLTATFRIWWPANQRSISTKAENTWDFSSVSKHIQIQLKPNTFNCSKKKRVLHHYFSVFFLTVKKKERSIWTQCNSVLAMRNLHEAFTQNKTASKNLLLLLTSLTFSPTHTYIYIHSVLLAKKPHCSWQILHRLTRQHRCCFSPKHSSHVLTAG